MADTEAMFLCLRNGEASYAFFVGLMVISRQELGEYEMCVHLFGAISSPSCANMALKKTADDSLDTFGGSSYQS